MRIMTIVGNPNPGGRTTATGEAVAARIAEAAGGARTETVELAHHAERIFRWEAPELDALCQRVAGSEAVVFACPTYKASFTGLLKAFLDRYGPNGLAGVVAVPVMLGASPVHWLAPETQLRPVLVELAATVPSKALFMVDDRMEQLGAIIEAWWELAGPPILRGLGHPA